MNLHRHKDEFETLCTIVANHTGIPDVAVKRDYYIVMMLEKLARSDYADKCVFKGGTSLSKCYPGTISRFSEDIDLTYIPNDHLGKKQYSKELKHVESLMSEDACTEKITNERNDRNKSSYVWFEDQIPESTKVKLEIGSSIKPEPYSKKTFKTYIQEYLEEKGLTDDVDAFELAAVELNVLNIERTFLDKVMAVKRHAICGTLLHKTRHIYDVVQLYNNRVVKTFLSDTAKLKTILQITKTTDSFYLEKREVSKEYNPVEAYAFEQWKSMFSKDDIKRNYEKLHQELLYTDEAQEFDLAVRVFEQINNIFKSIDE